ncbi:Na+/H+ antiporter NhaA [Sphingomonas sp. CGMCC 1.13654]|uniref:Na(+)/H(+) antiporter NhaA n=1 Tax=Sphingomonas chungangi TaxID=2683589 RepID=A0A838L952_9SPHN|nr:Na+/H+ antiporter NhaA [Sphingomonas chungangi]MBA2934666.1 Na+/H+ antiporter NhaA [Sphingomonas chungangi]MVW57977.1 Na+/H+ antiporter NhaA [Sphingomonas chungangi]
MRRAVTRSFLAVRDHLSGEAAPGLVLMAAAALALIVANSPLGDAYQHALHARIGPLGLQHWINDGLMAVFFLFVGLEVKREVVAGDLSTPAARRLPVIAAAAGMILPALVYVGVTRGDPAYLRGWAIPAATDIAFAIGVLALLGPRVPASLKLFLTTVAIVDDIGAVAIIALAYTSGLNGHALAATAVLLVLLWLLNRRGVRALWPYALLALLLWAAVLKSGVHATVAGVVAAMFVPLGDRDDDDDCPLTRLEHGLSPWVSYAILPVFAFANAGVALGDASFWAPLALAVALGLFLGKQIGVFGAMRGAVALGWAEKPEGAGWAQLYGVALLAGIGFTMSLFIGGLAFADPLLIEEVKIGVLAGSLLSALAGYAVLRIAAR